MRVDVVLVKIEFLKLGVSHNGIKDQLEAFVADSVELQTEGEQVTLVPQEAGEVFHGLVFDLVVIEIQLLDSFAPFESNSNLFQAVVADAVVLDAQLYELGLTLQPVLRDLHGTALVELVV